MNSFYYQTLLPSNYMNAEDFELARKLSDKSFADENGVYCARALGRNIGGGGGMMYLRPTYIYLWGQCPPTDK